ncbi:MAG: envelope stress response membrane protein PspB [Gammaproteobacteria bacterium]|nr:envelope stress response membrane protein PspB [Gammaproteobacteria bacterium]
MGIFEFIIALVSIVLGCITLWIIMFYSRKEKRSHNQSSDARYSLNKLSAMAESLQDRIDTLESILDAEVPHWREPNERSTDQTSN